MIHAVHLLSGLGFLVQIDGFRGRSLHAVGQLVGFDARLELIVGGILPAEMLIHVLQQIERGALLVRPYQSGPLQVEDRRVALA